MNNRSDMEVQRADAILSTHDEIFPAVFPSSRIAIAGCYDQAKSAFDQAQSQYQANPGLRLVLCVAAPDCLWVSSRAEAYRFFYDTYARPVKT